ncbi:MAG: ATP-binding protein [Bdellovibrionota bacterium]|nr:ATP-binding protein [Bdellovibrionota bacterium]
MKNILTYFNHSLVTKVTAFYVTTVTACLVLTSLFYFKVTTDLILESVREIMDGEVILLTEKVSRSFDEVRNDLELISKTPPFHGIIRSRKNGGIDPFDKSTVDMWRDRLATIFTSILSVRPAYSQFRFLSLEGYELVRVNRIKEGFDVVPSDKLQDKSGEPYIKRAKNIKDGEVVFSKISRNIENGIPVTEERNTLRSMRGIFYEGQLVGYLIGNINFNHFLKEIVENIPHHSSVRLEGYLGNSIDLGAPFPKFEDSHQSRLGGFDKKKKVFFQELRDYMIVSRRYNYNKKFPNEYMKIYLATPMTNLLQKFDEASKYSFIILFSLNLVVVVLFFMILKKKLRPLGQMSDRIKEASESLDLSFDLPVEFEDEIGSLARSFNSLKERLGKTLVDLQRSNDELEKFAYIASHDLKSPLRAIDNLSQWIEEDLREIANDQTKTYLEQMRGRVFRMERLLDALLEYSRVGRETYSTTYICLNDVVDGALQVLNIPPEITIKKDIELQDFLVHELPLSHVLQNLIGNAIKHNDGPLGKIEISVREKAGFLHLGVKDNGSGIEEKYHQKIFEMFQTLKSRDEVEGSGMGLALIKKIVEKQGGSIQVKSKLNEGSEFIFTWSHFKKKDGAQ